MGFKLAGYLIAFALVAGSYYYAFDKGGDLREATIKAAIGKSNQEAAAKAAKGTAAATKNLERDTDAILHSNGDGPLAPVLRDQLDRMRNASN